jgi:hypothetical protein
MFPAIPPPKELTRRSVDFKLKPGWRFDEEKGVFIDPRAVEYAAPRLPKNSRIVYKVPDLARSPAKKLSHAEKDLQRYMQVILPSSGAARSVLRALQSLTAVEEAHFAPELSLPSVKPARAKRRR